MWNLWHGCTKISPGCQNCYMFRRDAEYGKDSTIVTKTGNFRNPVKKDRSGNYKMQPGRGTVMTCFTSDFFHPDADEWRAEAWAMMKERSDLDFYFITKRPDRFFVSLPGDWGDGYDNVTICCTCEDQEWTDRRLPVFMELPVKHKEIIHEPMLEEIHLEKYLEKYPGQIEAISVGGESGEEDNGAHIRLLDYSWVVSTRDQCLAHGISFRFHQTGTYFRMNGKTYHIPRYLQGEQARKSGLDT